MDAQLDLFGSAAPAPPAASLEVVEMIRRRLLDTLAMLERCDTLPWTDILEVVRQENSFRYSKDILPPEEGARLWAAFDAQLDRLWPDEPDA